VITFLKALLSQIHRKLRIIWDGLLAYCSLSSGIALNPKWNVSDRACRPAPRNSTPPEYVWGHAKYHASPTTAPVTLRSMQRRPSLNRRPRTLALSMHLNREGELVSYELRLRPNAGVVTRLRVECDYREQETLVR
jgi:hypothetical protein